MKPEYLVLVAVLIPSLASVVLALWKEPPTWLRVTGGVAAVLSAILSGIAGIEISKEGTALTTGGDSACYLVNLGTPNPPFPAIVEKSGEYPLYSVEMRIVDLIEPFKPMQIPNASKPFDLGISLSLGDFPIGDVAKEVSFSLPAKGDRASFNVFFDARNGFWAESLRLRLVNGDWKRAIQVFRDLPNQKEKQLYKQIDKGFPTEADGSVKW